MINMVERLQKILARAGYGSRRACEAFILQGRVRVNGRVAELGQKADPGADTITLDGEPIALETPTYVALHKPRGVVSSLNPQGDRKTVRDLVPLPGRLYPVGRLDVDSEGLILLTNDGALTETLTHPRYQAEKEYRVLVASRGGPDQERLNVWRRGVVIEGKRTAPAKVRREESVEAGTWLRVIMHEGRKHEIRDIGAALGIPVLRLIRVRLGALTLGDLKPGQWRRLRADEVKRLMESGQARGGNKVATRHAASLRDGRARRAGEKSKKVSSDP
jgi:23S rRNA pseudouridine2605 synthase